MFVSFHQVWLKIARSRFLLIETNRCEWTYKRLTHHSEPIDEVSILETGHTGGGDGLGLAVADDFAEEIVSHPEIERRVGPGGSVAWDGRGEIGGKRFIDRSMRVFDLPIKDACAIKPADDAESVAVFAATDRIHEGGALRIPSVGPPDSERDGVSVDDRFLPIGADLDVGDLFESVLTGLGKDVRGRGLFEPTVIGLVGPGGFFAAADAVWRVGEGGERIGDAAAVGPTSEETVELSSLIPDDSS